MTQSEGDEKNPRSSIIWGVVRHWRAEPKRHAFSYPMITLQLDVDTFESTSISPLMFGVDRRAVCSIHTGDYLEGGGSLRERVEAVMHGVGAEVSPARITLVTMPRLLGYVFNPVSFFIAFDAQDRVLGCVTQVNNTFGEAHIYPLVCVPSVMPVFWRFPKKFFVSPFFDTQGEYEVTVKSEGQILSIQVDLYREESLVFSASLEGMARNLSRRNLVNTLLRYPLSLLLTMPRIHVQALILFFKAKATPFDKPPPSDPYTIRSQQNRIHRMRLWLLAVLKSSRRFKAH
jgi:cyclopropane-fatty-acyl-phospholipid synthase